MRVPAARSSPAAGGSFLPTAQRGHYNARVETSRPHRRTFSLHDAQQLLPEVKRLTAAAVNRAERVASQLEQLEEADPAREQLAGELNDIVNAWADSIRALDADVKGLWLVDFDTGDGYYCWMHPEPSVTHYHSYDDGFAGRMKIT